MVARRNRGHGGFTDSATPFDGAAARPEDSRPTTMTATDAKNRFGELLDLARRQPVHVQKNGRTVAVMLSPEEYRHLVEASAAPKVRPIVEKLLEKSIERRRSLYEALAR